MVRFDRGQLQFVRANAPPIGIHWTFLAGLALFSRFTFDPMFCLGYLAIVLVHEFGHATLVKAFALNVEAIELHGLGGECRYSGAVTQRKRNIIAWGGVTAQTLLLAVTLMVGLALSPEGSWAQLYHTLTVTNAIIIAINLIPLPGFDGFHAWRLVGGQRKAKTTRLPVGRKATPKRRRPAESNVVRFPVERVGQRHGSEAGDASGGSGGDPLSDVNAQIFEIAERVNKDRNDDDARQG